MITPFMRLERPFLAVTPIDITDFNNDMEKLNLFIHDRCVKQGTPIVLTNLQSLPGWNKELFDLNQTVQLYGDQGISIERPEAPLEKKVLPIGDYLSLIRSPSPSPPPFVESLNTAESPRTISSTPLSPSWEPESPVKTPSTSSPDRRILDLPSVNDNSTTTTGYAHDKLYNGLEETIIDTTLDGIHQQLVNPLPCMDINKTLANNTITDKAIQLEDWWMKDYQTGVQVTISKRVQTDTTGKRCYGVVPPEKQQQSNESTTKRQHKSQPSSDRSSPKRFKCDNEQTHDTIDRNRYYAKDIDCLDEYKECLSRILPASLLPLGDSDLMRTLPSSLQAINLLCYLGGNQTGTALHCDISGAIGHNIMTFGDESAYAQWLIIKKEESHKLRVLCQEANDNTGDKQKRRPNNNKKSYFLECEQAYVLPEHLADHGITTYVIFQRPGDLVIIPSLCYHQVSNIGVSFKMAWNRVTHHSLVEGIKLQLPLYRACRILLHLYANDVIRPEIIEDIPIENVDNKGIIQEDAPSDVEVYHGFDVVCDFCCAIIMVITILWQQPVGGWKYIERRTRKCSQACLYCQPISTTRLGPELVYFRDMSQGRELWGGFRDTGLLQTACWPDYVLKVRLVQSWTEGHKKTMIKSGTIPSGTVYKYIAPKEKIPKHNYINTSGLSVEIPLKQ
ncbi:hypothetical protein BC941DRAFT_451359 [Chlamydoabsidia padenii]|nr:hypothetical protein BC941DRAFT_451359 [Chlamydoabsidia padenii]